MKDLTEFEIKKINYLIFAIRTKTLLCNIESVSKSGMTRKLSFLTIAGGQVWRFNDLFQIDGYRLDKNYNVIVTGCGMDMVWNTVYTMAYKLNQMGFITDEDLPKLSQSSAIVI